MAGAMAGELGDTLVVRLAVDSAVSTADAMERWLADSKVVELVDWMADAMVELMVEKTAVESADRLAVMMADPLDMRKAVHLAEMMAAYWVVHWAFLLAVQRVGLTAYRWADGSAVQWGERLADGLAVV